MNALPKNISDLIENFDVEEINIGCSDYYLK